MLTILLLTVPILTVLVLTVLVLTVLVLTVPGRPEVTERGEQLVQERKTRTKGVSYDIAFNDGWDTVDKLCLMRDRSERVAK